MSSDHTERASSSRLSPLARPFNLNPNSLHHQYQPQYLNVDLSHFDAYANHSSSSSLQYGSQLPFNILQIPRWKDKDGAVPVPGAFSSKRGKSPAEELKALGELSESLHGKCIGISGKENEDRSKEQQIEVECVPFSTISELWPNTITEYPQSEMCPTTYRSCDSNIISCERNLSQLFDSYAAKLRISYSSDSDFPVQVSAASDAHTYYLPFDLLLHQNLYSEVHGAVSNNNQFNCNPSSIKESYTLLDNNDKEVFHELMMAKYDDGKDGKSIAHEVIDSLTVSKSELHITHPSSPHYLTLKLHGTEEDDPVEYSSKMLGENDSDLDSPCWKGTMTANQSTLEHPGHVNLQHLKSGQEALSSFSPLSSQFSSSDDEQNINYCESECDGDNASLFLKSASLTVSLPSEELISTNSITAGSSSSEQRNRIGIHSSNNICLPDEEHALLKKNGPNVAGFARWIEDPRHDDSTSISFASNVFSSSSCTVGVPADFTETHGSATRSFSMPPRLDIQRIVITMNELSELLMQKYSNDLDSLNEHEHDIIQSIISNLTVCIRNWVVRKNSDA
ncbi:hypothetical protein JCGZ_20333 [Jatropha curcas]|uniref:Uncharacterized protein n=1 Tax=Jatropha curcas TaxID=180498 RepID=A0A067JMR3_JATCU|nr:uncharacterized protein LOC105645551 [Jatropha curcas]XP_020539676.1 uncharacterized protein LOC105645551 [Jatropha curcas]KDP25177.1 hypothetical protein JCGZ_20333 [Jatropha curcas]